MIKALLVKKIHLKGLGGAGVLHAKRGETGKGTKTSVILKRGRNKKRGQRVL